MRKYAEIADVLSRRRLMQLAAGGVGAALWAVHAATPERAASPIRLHPENSHYFLFRGKPTVLITSGEHYGAILNLDFPYERYLDALRECGFNLTRTFSGVYREIEGAFGIPENTLAPAAGRFACPWERSGEAGASDGGRKFDLSQYSPAYFDRLKGFVAQAGRKGIVVELVLFCTMYDEKLWDASPMNARNNVNALGKVGPYEAYSGKDEKLTELQEALVRKIVRELNDFDNIYYEICNEPYERGGLTTEWNDRMVTAIVETEKELSAKHLIAQGFDRGKQIKRPNPHVSVFNFHAADSENVDRNYSLNKVVADDETGGKGTADLPYRIEAWEFILAGGGVFSHLDLSFTCGSPDGRFAFKNAPGGGGPEFRRQLRVLNEFINSFDFVRMKPEKGVVARITGSGASRPAAGALVQPGRAYAVYVRGEGPVELTLRLDEGAYRAEWIETRRGKIERSESIELKGETLFLISPAFTQDIALRIKRIERS